MPARAETDCDHHWGWLLFPICVVSPCRSYPPHYIRAIPFLGHSPRPYVALPSWCVSQFVNYAFHV
jgi:hypothetical protein